MAQRTERAQVRTSANLNKTRQVRNSVDWWARLLAIADLLPASAVSPVARALLAEARDAGAEISVVAGGRLKLTPGRIKGLQWEGYRGRLAPHRDAVKRLLTWTAGGGIPIRPGIPGLDGQLIYLTPNTAWLRDRQAVGYTPAEIEALKGMDPAAVAAAHMAKVELGGEVVAERRTSGTQETGEPCDVGDSNTVADYQSVGQGVGDQREEAD